jgi:hypothetical protein
MPAGKDSSLAGSSTLAIAHRREATSFLPDAESALAEFHHATPHTKDKIATQNRADTALMIRIALSIVLGPLYRLH